MQIVIDIPQKEYARTLKGEWNCTIINKAVANGTPLPKGHGRLKDTDELLKQSYRIDDSATLSTRDVVNEEEIDGAPTIIEADKGESEVQDADSD